MRGTKLNGHLLAVVYLGRPFHLSAFSFQLADFLLWLRTSNQLSVSAVMGYRSIISAVFRSVLPEISTSLVLHDLLRSFRVEAPARSVTPPSWDLLKVLS